jgi:hypothetical protein
MSRVHREFVELAAARLDGALAPAAEVRLAEHLATCPPCRERAAAYEADRAALRALREPAPPRDLWSRTAAALDRETARPARWPGILGSRRTGGPAGQRASRGAVAALVAVLVVAAVVGSTFFPGLTGPGGGPTVANATPFAIQPSVLAYVSTRAGEVGVYMSQVDRICPEGAGTTCQPVDPEVRKVASFTRDFVPLRLAISPDGRSAAVVGTSAGSGGVYTLAFPPEPTEIPTREPSQPTDGPTGSEATPTSTAVVPSGGSGEPAAIIDHVIVVGEAPAYSADGMMLAFSAMPADGSTGPDIYLWQVGDESAVPLTDDHGSIFASWAGSLVVGSRAGEALEGAADESGAVAPQSFLLDPATGEQRDLALAAWRPIVDPTGLFVIYWDGALVPSEDGRTWQEQRGGLYLAPWTLFDPEAVGTPEPTEEPGATPEPTEEPRATPPPTAEPGTAGGTPPTDAPSTTPGATDEPTDGPTSAPELSTPVGSPKGSPPEESASPAASPRAGQPVPLQAERDYESDPVLWWEIRWSPDGEWFGAWIGDAATGETPASGPETGRLTVGAVDRASGRIDPLRTQLDGAPAVRGFDLGDHRIAWATLPDPDGTSEVRLLVWTAEGRGLVRTIPRGGSDTLPAL